MKQILPRSRPLIFSFAILIFSFAQFLSAGEATHTSRQEKYVALQLSNHGKGANRKILNGYGVPFIEGTLPLREGKETRVEIGSEVRRIFLLGMTDATKYRAWSHPLDYPKRFFIGDEVGRIHLNYADGSTQVFPLILGESIWFGSWFYKYPEPFSTSERFRRALGAALRLYPPAPVKDGKYVAVIIPKPAVLRSITLEGASLKRGIPVIDAITVEVQAGGEIAGGVALSGYPLSPEFEKFAETKSLRPLGEDESQTQRRLKKLRQTLYSSDGEYHGRLAVKLPPGYARPEVSFQGNIFANILANTFHYNLQDMAAKVDKRGMYHTSTKGSRSWGGYRGFGTYRANVGNYYDQSWCRDMGRSLQELTELGCTNEAARCADYCLRTARLWEETPALKFKGQTLPPHWGRIANRPQSAAAFENDGHGLITGFLYKLWQRLPNRDEWLRARWPDVKAAGDWILWQFAHPEISGATNGVLHTTSECAAMNGYSVYADYVCMDALRELAQMADSIGETNSAGQWRDRADKMRQAIAANYIINDPKYGRIWTLVDAGWPQQSTVLGPLIFLADYNGFAPEDDDSLFHAANEAAYQRLIDTHQPFGFYGEAMGYGQGFITQSALLLDRMRDAGQLLDWMAKEIYDPKFGSFIVPEGCEMDPTGRFWYRIGDLGNGVQEAEIMKALRIVIGVDDTQPGRLQFFPRMPYDWKEMAVKKYPVLFERGGKLETARLRYKLERSGDKMNLEISSDKELGPVAMRLGPFAKRPDASSVLVNGKCPMDASATRSGDSWWVKFTMPVNQMRD
jgi:hypothetical protein